MESLRRTVPGKAMRRVRLAMRQKLAETLQMPTILALNDKLTQGVVKITQFKILEHMNLIILSKRNMCTFILYLLVRCQLVTLQVWNDSKCCIYKQEKYHSFHAPIVINCFLAAHPWCQICRSLRWKTSKKHRPTWTVGCWKRWSCMNIKYTHKCIYIYYILMYTVNI